MFGYNSIRLNISFILYNIRKLSHCIWLERVRIIINKIDFSLGISAVGTFSNNRNKAQFGYVVLS